MSLEDCFISFWKKCLDYYDVASRKEFWKTVLVWAIIYAIFFIGLINFGTHINPGRFSIVANILSIVIGFPWLALLQRRLNDTGMEVRHANMLVWAIILVPFIASYIPILYLASIALNIIIIIICIFPTGFFN